MMASAMIAKSESLSLGRRGSGIGERYAQLFMPDRDEVPSGPYVSDEFLTQFSGLTAGAVGDAVHRIARVSYDSSSKRRASAPDPFVLLLRRAHLAVGRHTMTTEEAVESDADLEAALADLGEVAEEARDQGFPEPSKETIDLADRLLRSMYEIRPCVFGVYPTQDGEVTIHAPGRLGDSVRVLCHAADGVMCLVNLNGQQHRRGVYMPVATSSASLRNFVREALDDLGSGR